MRIGTLNAREGYMAYYNRGRKKRRASVINCWWFLAALLKFRSIELFFQDFCFWMAAYGHFSHFDMCNLHVNKMLDLLFISFSVHC